MRSIGTLLAVLALVAACGGTTVSASGDASTNDASVSGDAASDASADGSTTVDAGLCVASPQSNLPGVRIAIEGTPCVFSLAQARAGITFSYDVIVDTDVPGVVPHAQDAGQCDQPDASGLITFDQIGPNPRYCLCDLGLCMPPSNAPVTIRAGRYHHTMSWDGTSWTGPSDTGNPHGPPFPPGSYVFATSASGMIGGDGGTRPFLVASTLAFTLTP